jgi:FxLD family lantipeptide
MSTPTIDVDLDAATTPEAEDVFAAFDLDITIIENTPATETVLMCSTGDTCGSSCPSACTTS